MLIKTVPWKELSEYLTAITHEHGQVKWIHIFVQATSV